MAMYALTRTLPDGTVKVGSPRPTLRATTVTAGQILYDNARVPKAEAQRFSAALARKPLGTEYTHRASGYTFRVDIAISKES